MYKYILIIFLFTSQFLFAKEFTVSSSDELNKVMKLVKEGDLIIWKSGAYKNQHISFHPFQNGTLIKPIRLMAETPGKVRFYGDSYLTLAGEYLQVDGFLFQGDCSLSDKQHVIRFSEGESSELSAHHCRVTNCAVIDYALTEESGTTNSYVALEGTYNELDHCYFKGKVNKGPTVIVNYLQLPDSEEGSDKAPSTHHHIHHNYFGYRTFSSNGGEQLRVGVSTTSGTKGFNIIEYNFFEDSRKEAEVISNKSCANVYRYNLLYNNDGALVLRHGTDCLVYGNYINGKSGRGQSGGIRIVNPRQTVFNNLIDNIEGTSTLLKAPLVVMSGFKGAYVNEYTPADHAIIAFNILRNSIGPAIKIGVCNTSKGRECQAPIDVQLLGNIVMNVEDDLSEVLHIEDPASVIDTHDNFYAGTMDVIDTSFKKIEENDVWQLFTNAEKTEKSFADIFKSIKKRAETFSIKLDASDISKFNADKIPSRKDVGVSWLQE